MPLFTDITDWADFDTLAGAWHGRTDFFLLESGMDPQRLGRYSMLGASPVARLLAAQGQVSVQHPDGQTSTTQADDPLPILRELLRQYADSAPCPLPFAGGAVGYLSYDLGCRLTGLQEKPAGPEAIPEAVLAIHDAAIVLDHREQRLFAIVSGQGAPAEARLQRHLQDCRQAMAGGRTALPVPQIPCPPPIRAGMDRQQYGECFRKIKEHIRAGDIYQINLARRFETDLPCTPWELHLRLRHLNPAPFSAFLNFPEVQVVSASPERFLQVSGRRLETRPIKGTRPRGQTPEEDERLKQAIRDSEKERAELLMIIDLERNDLGRVAIPGSVEVPEFLAIETYPTVHHQVATVTATLLPGLDALDALEATFPGGSITGAPKRRAMQLIDELEPGRRDLYTGALGWIGVNGDADFNILIRTFACKNGRAWFQTGGGIVWDSEAEAEFAETLHKAKALFQALGFKEPPSC